VTSLAGTTNLTYDFESRVTQISGPGINATYSYNGLDTRVGKTENSVSKTFRRSGAYVPDPVLGERSSRLGPSGIDNQVYAQLERGRKLLSKPSVWRQ
jgi:hypothetical protein